MDQSVEASFHPVKSKKKRLQNLSMTLNVSFDVNPAQSLTGSSIHVIWRHVLYGYYWNNKLRLWKRLWYLIIVQ